MITKSYVSKYLRMAVPTMLTFIIIYLLCYVWTDLGYSKDCFIYGPVGLPFYIESIITLHFVPMLVFLNQYDNIYGI